MKDLTQLRDLALARVRGALVSRRGGVDFKAVGRGFRCYGIRQMSGADISVGDNCWFEAITEYKGARFTPRLSLGSRTSFSSGVHISAVLGVTIHADCLFGSNVYIGDHSHGSTKAGRVRLDLPPASRPLEDAGEIVIGDRVWVGDGAVILAGTRIGDGCVVGANSVVKGTFPAGSLIVGAPARVAGDLA